MAVAVDVLVAVAVVVAEPELFWLIQLVVLVAVAVSVTVAVSVPLTALPEPWLVLVERFVAVKERVAVWFVSVPVAVDVAVPPAFVSV